MTNTQRASKHTPGPWHVEDDGSVQHESGMVICVPSYAEDFPCLTEDEDKTEDEVRAEVDAECAANARLIAAAPDLLAMLIECRKQIDTMIEDGVPTDWRMWRDDLAGLIAKTEGLTP